MIRCFSCYRGPADSSDVVAVFRVTPPGEHPAVWACAEHIKQTDAEIDPGVQEIVDIFEGK